MGFGEIIRAINPVNEMVEHAGDRAGAVFRPREQCGAVALRLNIEKQSGKTRVEPGLSMHGRPLCSSRSYRSCTFWDDSTRMRPWLHAGEFQYLMILRKFFGQELDRDEAMELGVLGLVHDPPATAATELLKNAVMGNGLAGHGL